MIAFRDIFVNNRLKVSINDKEYPVLGRLGMYHSIIDITNENIEIGDIVTIKAMSPLYVRTEIRREYK